MRILIEIELEVKIPEDRANVNEIFMAVQSAIGDARSEAATKVTGALEDLKASEAIDAIEQRLREYQGKDLS